MNNPDFTFAPNDPPVAPGAPPVVRDRPPPPKRVRRGFPFFTLLLFLILAGTLYVVWADPPGVGRALSQAGVGQIAATAGLAPEGAVDSLRERVDALAAKLASLAAPPPPDNTAQVQALSDRLDKLEKTIAQLQTQVAATPAPQAAPPATGAAPDLGDLPKQLADLSARVDALANRPAQAAAAAPDNSAAQQQLADIAQSQQKLDQAMAAQAARLDQLQATDKGALDNLSSQVNQVQAQEKDVLATLDNRVGTLEKGAGKVLGTASRAEQMTRVQAAEVALLAGQKLGDIPGAPPALARFADKAPPTDAELRESFPTYAEKARAVSEPELANKSFLVRSWLRLQESVTVRQGDDVLVGDPASGVLADAQARVQNDDLTGAVKALHHLKGPAANAVQGWVDQAQALIDARAALAAMAAQR
jgi:hypothetical protein